MERFRAALKATALWVDDFICALPKANVPNAEAYLLGGILDRLDAMMLAKPTGLGLAITPYTLDSTSKMILDKDTLNRVRDVSIWVESPIGGPTPVLRLGLTGATPNSGLRINAGQVNELGIIPADTTLYASCSVSITIYVISHF